MESTEFLRKDRARGQYCCLYIYFVLVYLLLSGILCNVCASEVTNTHSLTNNKDVVSCSSKPCKNGGSCVQYTNNVTCNCREGFTGDMCEIDIDECQSNPCPKKAQCVDGSNYYACVCKKGYNGDNCENEIDECASNPCENKGKCVDGINTYWCACKEGFTGERCEEIDECASEPCENGGVCFDGKNRYRCECPKGFTGKQCEKEIDECASNPCENKGKCIDGINTYWCACKEGFTGERCEEIDECASEPCENGGICFGGKNRYRCKCRRGFTGKRCEELRTFSEPIHPVYFVDTSLIVLLPVFSLAIITLSLIVAINLFSRSEAEERPRERVFRVRFRANLHFAEMKTDERRQYVIKRRQKHFEQYHNKELEIENNGHVILAYSDIPWPSKNDSADDKSVLFDYLELSPQEYRTYVRQQQIRWHPDRFFQIFGNHIQNRDMPSIMNRVTLLSQEINRIV